MMNPAAARLARPSPCPPGGRRRAIILVGLALAAAAAPAAALEPSGQAFIWNEANALLAAARTPEDALRAAQGYAQLVNDGVHNGPLFFNLGTALLQAGRPAAAAAALLRAERYLGRAPDLRRNLQIALARRDNRSAVDLPWYRIVLFWHYDWPAARRAAAAAVAFAAFWLACTLRVLGRRHALLAPLLALAVLGVALFGSSTAATWHGEATAPPMLVDAQPAAGSPTGRSSP